MCFFPKSLVEGPWCYVKLKRVPPIFLDFISVTECLSVSTFWSEVRSTRSGPASSSSRPRSCRNTNELSTEHFSILVRNILNNFFCCVLFGNLCFFFFNVITWHTFHLVSVTRIQTHDLLVASHSFNLFKRMFSNIIVLILINVLLYVER